jgi:membrane protein implicated in regulation of membrane protease activity
MRGVTGSRQDARRRGQVLAKYLVLQIPSWIGVCALLAGAVHWLELPRTLAAALFAAFVVKDLALYPILRRAYEPAEPSGAAHLVGALGVVTRPLGPEAYVRLGAELWRARVRGEAAPLATGERVRVREVDSLTLIVERVGNAAGAAGAAAGEGD